VGEVKRYPDFIQSTGYGLADGLKGVNCRHDFYFIDPEYSQPSYTDAQLAKMEADDAKLLSFETVDSHGKAVTKRFNAYDATQEMRHMEVQMRKKRQLVACFSKVERDTEAGVERAKYYAMRKEYERFCEVMGLEPQYQRVYMDGLGRV
jgi:hypothetical protein